jgi:hypothetical protein
MERIRDIKRECEFESRMRPVNLEDGEIISASSKAAGPFRS